MEPVNTKESAFEGYDKRLVEAVRKRIKRYVESLPAETKIESKYTMRVKGRMTNAFFGIVKAGLQLLAIESFPEEVNKKLTSLVFLKQCDYMLLDISIVNREAILESYFFAGENLGKETYNIGVFCATCLAALPESYSQNSLTVEVWPRVSESRRRTRRQSPSE